MIPIHVLLYAHCEGLVSIPALEPYRDLCEVFVDNTLTNALLLPNGTGLLLPNGQVLDLP